MKQYAMALRKPVCPLCCIALIFTSLKGRAQDQDLTDRIAILEELVRSQADRIAVLEDKLAHFSRQGDDVFITGANLHVVNGMGTTYSTNGKGNLIVGYNEPRPDSNDRTGSHNLVLGRQHNFSSYGGIVSGEQNWVKAPYNAAISGFRNVASGSWAAMFAGGDNEASGAGSVMIGGGANRATGGGCLVAGGYLNTSAGNGDSMLGGLSNQTNGYDAVVVGGRENRAIDIDSFVGGAWGKSRQCTSVRHTELMAQQQWTCLGGIRSLGSTTMQML